MQMKKNTSKNLHRWLWIFNVVPALILFAFNILDTFGYVPWRWSGYGFVVFVLYVGVGIILNTIIVERIVQLERPE